MKKIIIAILGILLITFISKGDTDSENKYVSLNLKDSLLSEGITPSFTSESDGEGEVTIYLFRGDGCSHCRDFLEYLNEIEKEHGDKFKLVSYEVWRNANNNDLKEAVISELGITSSGVPLIVIGDKHYVGFGEQSKKEILNKINVEYEKEEKTDIVKSLSEKYTNDNTLLYILIGIIVIAGSYETYKYLKTKKIEKIELEKKEARKIRKAEKKQNK